MPVAHSASKAAFAAAGAAVAVILSSYSLWSARQASTLLESVCAASEQARSPVRTWSAPLDRQDSNPLKTETVQQKVNLCSPSAVGVKGEAIPWSCSRIHPADLRIQARVNTCFAVLLSCSVHAGRSLSLAHTLSGGRCFTSLKGPLAVSNPGCEVAALYFLSQAGHIRRATDEQRGVYTAFCPQRIEQQPERTLICVLGSKSNVRRTLYAIH